MNKTKTFMRTLTIIFHQTTSKWVTNRISNKK